MLRGEEMKRKRADEALDCLRRMHDAAQAAMTVDGIRDSANDTLRAAENAAYDIGMYLQRLHTLLAGWKQ